MSDLTDQFVGLNAGESAEPDARNAAVYRDSQGIQDEMSAALRDTFTRHR